MQRHLAIITVFLLVLVQLPTPTRAAGHCVTDWFVSYGGVKPYELLWTDPDGLPLAQLRFDWGYHDPDYLSDGFIDFNGNGLTDVFSAVPRPDGALQWRYWDVSTDAWVNLAYAYDPLDGLRFGDFNGDGKTDLFSTALRTNGTYQWRVSLGGTASYQNLNSSRIPIQSLRFGDFNGDNRTDVFAALVQPGGSYNWVYSASGTGSFQTFSNGESFSTASMLFGDVQPESAQGAGSDGKTDIFLILPNGGPLGDGSPEYVWRSPLIAAYKTAIAGTDRTALRMGDFNGDSYTDIFFQIPLAISPGTYQWRMINGATDAVQDLAYGITPVSGLRFGDFDGSGRTDVLLAVPRCSVYLPTVVR
jgi:hypothetical protein